MTKEEKLKKIKEILNEDENTELEEESVYIPVPVYIDPLTLAATVAVHIPNARWAAVNFDGDMHWYEEEPESIIAGKWYTKKGPCHSETGPYRVPCEPESIDSWKKAKWRIR